MKLEAQKIINVYSYSEYKELMNKLIDNKDTTGEEKSAEKIEFTWLNGHRIKRLDKTVQINESLVNCVGKIEQPILITIITESWCGDAAQQIPWFAKLNDINNKVKLQLVLRDENPDFMNNYLTNGSKSIPVIIFSNSNNEQLYKWGPRPKALQDLIAEWSKTTISKEEKLNKIHTWYATNKGEALQSELAAIFSQL